ncbi:MAG TPA: ATP-binding protein [Bacillota bacterium]|nr:ATP-binding protein [Bacillota bacterium]
MKDISLHILDLVQNSISAGAAFVEITIKDILDDNTLSIIVSDDGIGMNETQVTNALDPFYTTRTTRNVGLGIPMFKAQAEASGGSFVLISEEGKGTRIEAIFNTRSIDCLPTGNMVDTMTTLILCNPDVDFTYTHVYNGQRFEFKTIDIKARLDEVSIAQTEVITWIRDYISENINELYGGVNK